MYILHDMSEHMMFVYVSQPGEGMAVPGGATGGAAAAAVPGSSPQPQQVRRPSQLALAFWSKLPRLNFKPFLCTSSHVAMHETKTVHWPRPRDHHPTSLHPT